jgi:glycosyltransferase involved in cell wall biosynthesis
MPRQVPAVARVALVETYPYEAVWGGDAVYLDAIRCFLTGRGHFVDSYVTDVTRGRSNPAVTLQTQASGNHRWHVRNALALGPNRYCSLDPRLLGKALRRLPGRRAPKDDVIEAVEAEWIVAELQDNRPDLVILAFGACPLAETVAASGVRALALKGFFSNRRIRLGGTLPTPIVSPELLESLAHASTVGFNNRHDLELYSHLTGRKNGVLISIGMPSRIQPPSDAGSGFLYAAARTKPNIESLEWFFEKVWPAVLSVAPEAELRVVGSIGAAFAGRAFPRAHFLGFVNRLEDEYRRCAAVAAPFVNGSSGVKTKIAEALSHGRPVVTTSIGVDLEPSDRFGEAVVVADNAGDFAQAMVHVLQDRRVRSERHELAAEQFRRHFTPEAAYRPILDLLEPSDVRRHVVAT